MRRAVVGGVVGLLLWPSAPVLAADGDPVTGWWSRTRIGAPAPTEAPDPVPEGGTWVARDPSGPVAISALRVELADDVRATSIVLQVDQANGPVQVQACPAAARWQPVDGDPIDQAPTAECETSSAEGALEGGGLVIALPESTPAGPLDVVLLPAGSAAFSATLKRATRAAVTTEPAGPAAGDGAEVPLPPPVQSPAAEVEEPAGLQPAQDGPVAAPVPEEGSADPPLLAEAALPPPAAGPPADVPGAAPPEVAPAEVAPQVGAIAAEPRALSQPDDRRQALSAALLLAGIVALALRLLQTTPRPVRALGGAARRSGPAANPAFAAVAAAFAAVPGPGVPLRGLGRFRAARSEPPVRL